jgi:hypothetical protein
MLSAVGHEDRKEKCPKDHLSFYWRDPLISNTTITCIPPPSAFVAPIHSLRHPIHSLPRPSFIPFCVPLHPKPLLWVVSTFPFLSGRHVDVVKQNDVCTPLLGVLKPLDWLSWKSVGNVAWDNLSMGPKKKGENVTPPSPPWPGGHSSVSVLDVAIVTWRQARIATLKLFLFGSDASSSASGTSTNLQYRTTNYWH